ncbi:MAG: hypothetical protein WD357_05270 [Gracilimonas sp.]
MKKINNNISVFFLLLAMVGTMLSMLHYHSDGLECISHANEQHFTENELLCPVAGIVAVNGAESQPSFDGLLKFHQPLVDVTPLYLSAQPFIPLLGRAPPFMA